MTNEAWICFYYHVRGPPILITKPSSPFICFRLKHGVSRRDNAVLKPLLGLDVLLEASALLSHLPGGRALPPLLLRAQPRLVQTLPSAVRHLASSAKSAAEGVVQTLRRREASMEGPSSLEAVAAPLLGCRAVLLTLRALLPACPRAMLASLCQEQQLLECMALLHDRLCPVLAVRLSGDNAEGGGALAQLRAAAAHIELASASVASLLVCQGVLGARPEDGVCAGAEDEDEAGGCSSSGGGAGSSRGDPGAAAAGAALVEAAQALVSSGPIDAVGSAAATVPTLANALVETHGFAAAVARARDRGLIELDDAQIDYLAALLPGIWQPPARVSGPEQGTNSAPSGYQPAPLQLAAVETVRGLLPDVGPGFAAACLDASGGSPEAAISAILDGNVPAAVATLGRNAGWDAYARFIGAPAAAKPPSNGTTTPSTPAKPSTRPAAGSVKPRASSRYLDARETSLRRQLQTRALEAQWEYEDEFDDSLEDLAPPPARDVTADDEGAEAAAAGVSRLSLGAADGPARGARPDSKRRGAPGLKQWVLNGRVYNYKKEGATQATSNEHLQQLLTEASAKKEEIHGLGRGGNRPIVQATSGAPPADGRAPSAQAAPRDRESGGERKDSAPRDRRRKEQHKSGVANHHRKDRAAQKLQRAM